MQVDLPTPSHVLFVGARQLAAGDLLTVARAFGQHQGAGVPALIFETATGRQVDVDVSGSPVDLERRYAVGPEEAPQSPGPRRGRGRPKLGVVGREVTLLPRHWEWLDGQRGGASAALRRLVDQARRSSRQADLVRWSQDRANRFLSVMAGNLPGFEEATRALFAGDRTAFAARTRRWPEDIRRWAFEMADEALAGP